MESKIKECVQYLKINKGYDRIIKCIIDKYKSLGKLGGYIILENLTMEEQNILAPLDYKVYQNSKCKISIQKFINNFCMGKFEEIEFLKVIQLYSPKEVVTHKERRLKEQELKENFFKKIIQVLKCSLTREWLEETLSGKLQGCQLLIGQYNGNQQMLEESIKGVDRAIEYLMSKKGFVPLVMLATEVTSNPHYFDIDELAFRLLLYVLSYKEQIKYPETVQERNETLYKAGILRDEISTSTIAYNIEGYKEGEKLAWEVFWEQREPMELMLYNLKKFTKITTKKKKVYIVENPTVFILLLEKLVEEDVALVCTSGQLNTADRLLIELLINGGNRIYYNGDFDPDGLQIAQKVKEINPKQIVLWGYSVERYLSGRGVYREKVDLAKLETIYTEELLPVTQCLKEKNKMVYQESLIESLIEDIRSKMEKD